MPDRRIPSIKPTQSPMRLRDGRTIFLVCDCGREHLAVLFHLQDGSYRIEWFCHATFRFEDLTDTEFVGIFILSHSKNGKELVTYNEIQSAKQLMK